MNSGAIVMPLPTPAVLAEVTALRRALWHNGHRPVAVRTARKEPVGLAWPSRARLNPPAVVAERVKGFAMNTGILCDGLRAVDIDIDSPDVAEEVAALAIATFGDTLCRTRENSPRSLLLYRAAERSPGKREIIGTADNKIEVLGEGQQFVAFGAHPSGAKLEWTPIGPDLCPLTSVPAVTEDQITTFLAAAAPLIGAASLAPPPPPAATGGAERTLADLAPPSAAAVLDLLHHMPNTADVPHGKYADIMLAAAGCFHSAKAAGQSGAEDIGPAAANWAARWPGHPDPVAALEFEVEKWETDWARRTQPYAGWDSLRRHAREIDPKGYAARQALSDFGSVDLPAPPMQLTAPAAPLTSFTFDQFEGVDVPPRRWIVPDWMPCGYVTSLYAEGGCGKTLIAQQLMAACAAGRPWLGLDVAACPAFGLLAEDAADELHRRQADINHAMGLSFRDLGRMRAISPIGLDPSLMTFDRSGKGITTSLYDQIVRECVERGERLVIIDTAAQCFAGNENDRAQVSQFIAALNRIAIAVDGAVLLLIHPSRAGVSNGSMDGASTAWSNSSRSRLALNRVQSENGREPDTSARLLTRRKSNYATIGDALALRWDRGFLHRCGPDGYAPFAHLLPTDTADSVFVQLLDRCKAEKRDVSSNMRAGNYAPKLFSKMPASQGYLPQTLHAAMERLFEKGAITTEEYGRKSDRRTRIVLCDGAATVAEDFADVTIGQVDA